MAFFGKTYNLVSQENFDAWLKANGISEEKVGSIVAQKSSTKIVKNGDTYTLSQSGASGDKEVSFKSGVEFDDTIGQDNIPVKTTITVDGNTVTQVVKGAGGTSTFKREFNGDDLVVTISGSQFDGVAKRFYKA